VAVVALSALLVVGMLGAVPTAEAATPVDQCREINESVVPGDRTVLLNQSVSATGTCFEVATSDVILDGQGNTLTGDGTGTGIAVENASRSLSNVTVRNVTVRNFEDGVGVVDATGVTLADVNASANGEDGLRTDDSTAGLVVRDSVLSDNGNSGADTSAQTTFENVTANDNANGLFVRGTGSVIRNATVEDNVQRGIGVSASDTTVADSTVTNTNAALRVYATDTNATVRNVTIQNGWASFESENNTVSGLTVRDSNFFGVSVEASGNEFRNLTVRNAGTAGANDGVVVDDAGDTLVVDATVTGSSADNVNVTSQGTVTLRNVTSTGAALTGVAVDRPNGAPLYTTDVVVESSNLSANGVYGASSIGATNLTVRDSLVESNGFEGVSAGRANTVVDGVTVRDNGFAGVDAQLAVDQPGDVSLTVRDSTVTGTSSYPGIVVANVDEFEVTNTTVSGFDGDGIAVRPGESVVPDAVLRNVSVTGVAGDGVSLANATDAAVAGSSVTGVTAHGVNVTDSTGVVLDGLTLDNNGQFGIRSTAAADGLVVRNATITGHSTSPYAAALLDGTTTVENATVENNRQGLRVAGADSVVANSTFAGNLGHVTVNADRVTVRDSSADGFGNVRMFAGTGSVVSNVTFTGGSYLVDDGATGTTFRNVTVTAPGAQEGILLNGATDTLVVDSSVTGGSASGVELGGTANATLRNVTLANNADGVSAAGPGDATGLTVANASIRDNAGEGLSTFDDATVRDSTFVGNGAAGVSVRAVATLSNTSVGNTTFAIATLSNVDAAGVTAVPASPSGLNDADAYVNLTATSGSGYADVVVAYTDADVSGTPGVDEDTLALYNHEGGTWSPVPGSTVDTAANTVRANVTSFSTFAPLGAEQTVITRCREIDESVVPASRTVYLGGDVSAVDTGGCLRVTASDVTLDGQGYLLDGAGGGDDGILVGNASGTTTNVTIRDIEVSGYLGDAIDTNATGTVVENARLTSYDNGIDANAPTVVRDTTIEDTTSGEGILSGGDLTVRNSTVVDNADDGIYVTGPGMILTNVTVRNNDAYGVDGADDVLVRDVVSENNVEDGIYADDNTTVENVSLLNNDGWGIDAGSDVSIRDARAVDNGDDGIKVVDDSLIQNVVTRGNGDDGISAGDNVTVQNVSITNNADDGVEADKNMTVRDLSATTNGEDGVDADDGADVRRVTVVGGPSDDDGIELGDNATVRDVSVDDTDGDGVYAGDGADIRNVTVVGSGQEGLDFSVAGSPGVFIRNATVRDSGGNGIEAGTDAVFENVTVVNSTDVDVETGQGVRVTDLTVGDTRLAAARLANVDLNATDAGAAPAPPSDLLDVGAYVEMTDRTASAYADVTVAYADADASGVDESSLALYRYDGTAWTAVGGTNDPDANTVRANATAFSVFAPLAPEAAGDDDVTGPTGDVEVTDADLSTTSVETGESVTVSATVENTQGATAAKTLRLRVDGISAAQQTVYVPADTNETYQFSYAPSRTGEFDVTVNGLDAGTLDVSEAAAGGGGSSVVGGAETPTPTDGSSGAATPTDGSSGAATPTDGSSGAATPTETSPVTPTDEGGATPTAASGGEGDANTPAPTEGGGPGFGVVAAVTALLAAALVAVRRQ
jgi:PGF-CTERM protein